MLSTLFLKRSFTPSGVVELAGEGERFNDIRRWGWLDDQQKWNELQQRDPGFEGFVDGREYLPQNEIDTNPTISENNPGH